MRKRHSNRDAWARRREAEERAEVGRRRSIELAECHNAVGAFGKIDPHAGVEGDVEIGGAEPYDTEICLDILNGRGPRGAGLGEHVEVVELNEEALLGGEARREVNTELHRAVVTHGDRGLDVAEFQPVVEERRSRAGRGCLAEGELVLWQRGGAGERHREPEPGLTAERLVGRRDRGDRENGIVGGRLREGVLHVEDRDRARERRKPLGEACSELIADRREGAEPLAECGRLVAEQPASLNLREPLREHVDPLHERGRLGRGERIGVEGRRRTEHQSLFERLAAKACAGWLRCLTGALAASGRSGASCHGVSFVERPMCKPLLQ